MSVCRRGPDSDVYMFPSGGMFVCCGCVLGDGHEVCLPNPEAARLHLTRHVLAGHKVPAYAFDDLKYRDAATGRRL